MHDRLHLILGDITRQSTDAIVNAANSHLLPGGGVCDAIHAAAGPQLARACAEWVSEHGAVPTGGAAITPGFALKARWVIHAVGPVWHGGTSGEATQLAGAYCSALLLADAQGLATISFPSISTGIFGYPLMLAAPVAVSAILSALEHAAHVSEVTLVAFDSATLATYEAALG